MKVGSDNVKKCLLERHNRQVMEYHTEAETCINFILGTECERANDATWSAALRLIERLLF